MIIWAFLPSWQYCFFIQSDCVLVVPQTAVPVIFYYKYQLYAFQVVFVRLAVRLLVQFLEGDRRQNACINTAINGITKYERRTFSTCISCASTFSNPYIFFQMTLYAYSKQKFALFLGFKLGFVSSNNNGWLSYWIKLISFHCKHTSCNQYTHLYMTAIAWSKAFRHFIVLFVNVKDRELKSTRLCFNAHDEDFIVNLK